MVLQFDRSLPRCPVFLTLFAIASHRLMASCRTRARIRCFSRWVGRGCKRGTVLGANNLFLRGYLSWAIGCDYKSSEFRPSSRRRSARRCAFASALSALRYLLRWWVAADPLKAETWAITKLGDFILAVQFFKPVPDSRFTRFCLTIALSLTQCN